ncbi:hypothetical protein [Corallococcus macrosporus]|uniref:Uncharacterized protein n=1 Tax=Myxococcus fulvus (strain ATCC BAA-855 / HW-1) TaxID=483219 RepID=F8CMX8_MYXFH|nr:hypothetical protein [Corallococcus macrosporus]AEI66600.1 hypothetical protein LILAB_23525 [Corallococcus macrosporus]
MRLPREAPAPPGSGEGASETPEDSRVSASFEETLLHDRSVKHDGLTQVEQLLFFDRRLSEPKGQGPFLNPLEQNNPNVATVVAKVCDGPYGKRFRADAA